MKLLDDECSAIVIRIFSSFSAEFGPLCFLSRADLDRDFKANACPEFFPPSFTTDRTTPLPPILNNS